jgi:predicted dithiol-disulfide oxidoreductase (DUF899 family)
MKQRRFNMTTAATEVATPKTVSHDEWLTARKQFLKKEKEFTRLRDELSRERRELPREEVQKQYIFEVPGGARGARAARISQTTTMG